MSPSGAVSHGAETPVTTPRCQRCGFELHATRPMGCKNPCTNCGTVYPMGDCSD